MQDLRIKLGEVFETTMGWLVSEVFNQDTRRKKTEAEIEQDEFKEEYARDMEEAVALM